MPDTSSETERLIDTCLDDRYQLEELVGKGGMGEVYRARQLRLNRVVAVKIPRKGIIEDQNFRIRFNREAHSMARVQHENICQIFDVFLSESPDRPSYLVLEYVQGTRLDRWINDNLATLIIGDLLDIFMAIARALDAAHAMNIVHRDIKPSNILITPDGAPKVMDFGVAQVPDDIYTTRTGIAIGTPAYMSPEQVRGRNVGPKSDQYAYAMTIYKVFTGRIAFEAERSQQLAFLQLHEPPTPPSEFNPNLPFPIELIILKGLAKPPEERFANCEQMIQFMETVLGDHRHQPAYTLFPDPDRFGSARLYIGPQFDNLFGGRPWYRRYARELAVSAMLLLVVAALVLMRGGAELPLPPAGGEVARVGDDTRPGPDEPRSEPDEALEIRPDVTDVMPGSDSDGPNRSTGDGASSGPDSAEATGELRPPLAPENSLPPAFQPTPLPAPTLPRIANPAVAVGPSVGGDKLDMGGPLLLPTPTPLFGYDPNRFEPDELPSNRYQLSEVVRDFIEVVLPRHIEREELGKLRQYLLLLPPAERDAIYANFERLGAGYRDLQCTMKLGEVKPSRHRVEVSVEVALRGTPEKAEKTERLVLYQKVGALTFVLESRGGEWVFIRLPNFLEGAIAP